jgi:hypothetical protein
LCAEKCAHVDATIFKKVDLESIATELENLGLNKYGYRRMYNGITGEYIDCMIFIGPTYYQRLQKFTVDTMYSISAGPSDAITYQPLDKLLLVQVKNKIFASRILIGNTFKLQESLSNLIVLNELMKVIHGSGETHRYSYNL